MDVFSSQMSDSGSLQLPPSTANIQEKTLSLLSLRINYVGKLTKKEQKRISYIDTWKMPVICFSVSSLSRLFVFVRVWREAEEGRQRDSGASKCVFWSNACFSSALESPIQGCFFGVNACLLTCVFDSLRVWKGEFKTPVPEGVRKSRGLISSMTVIHQSSLLTSWATWNYERKKMQVWWPLIQLWSYFVNNFLLANNTTMNMTLTLMDYSVAEKLPTQHQNAVLSSVKLQKI